MKVFKRHGVVSLPLLGEVELINSAAYLKFIFAEHSPTTIALI
ncbi:hypothetical protein CZ797_13405 [Pseudoalteromonas sp. JB197]|nr:hypothetical protein CZ797_13405 [Pseudoalteromonas sp. JB197]